jgi:hypothetical protein
MVVLESTRLPGGIPHDEARIIVLLDEPGRREAAREGHGVIVAWSTSPTRSRNAASREDRASITNKLKRGTFQAAFFLACLAALELDGVARDEI